MEQNTQINDKISDKIRKLLSIAHDTAGAADNERETAMRQAYAMLAKYNLTLESISEEKNPRTADEVAIGHSMQWARIIAKATANLFFCVYIQMRLNKVNRCGHMFVGKQSNAVTAKELSIFLMNSVFKEGDKLRRERRKAGDAGANQYMTNFCKGAALAIRLRCLQLRADQEQSNSAEYPTTTGVSITLASLYDTEKASNNALIAAKLDVKYKDPQSIKYSRNDSFSKGQAFGNSLPLSRSISGKPERQQIS